MTQYLPIIISAIIIFTALMWWLLALGSVSKSSGSKDAARTGQDTPPNVQDVPPETLAKPAVIPEAKLMDDPTPSPVGTPPKPQAPLKAAATKAAPTKAPKAAPVAAKPVAPKAAPAKKTVTAEPVKAAVPKPAPKPAVTPAKAKATAPTAVPDNLLLLKGVGPKVNAMLKDMGVTRFEQVANWSPAEIAEIDAKLGAFAGRIGRDNWVDQARLLAAGDVAGFEKKYGALGSAAKS